MDVIDVMRFEQYIPTMFHPFVSRITDVPADGHCGYASIAVGLGLSHTDHYYVRQQMLEELDGPFSNWWETRIDQEMIGTFAQVRANIYWPNPLQQADEHHWLTFPHAGLIAAQRFNTVVHFLTTAGSQTYFPLRNGPPIDPDGNYYDHRVVTVCLVRHNHFINIRLDGEYPVPVVNTYCLQWRTPEAIEWELVYRHRIDDYIRKREQSRPPGTRTQYVDLCL